MWYHSLMIDFAITELLDDSICTLWLERHLHPDGLRCPGCGHSERRLFRAQGHFPAYRCRACEGYYILLTGTVFAKSRQRPATEARRIAIPPIRPGGALINANSRTLATHAPVL